MLDHETILNRVREVKGNRPLIGTAHVYAVESNSEEGLIYYVMEIKGDWLCTCKGWRFTDGCKHIDKVIGAIRGA